jgi:hypothetical protein
VLKGWVALTVEIPPQITAQIGQFDGGKIFGNSNSAHVNGG